MEGLRFDVFLCHHGADDAVVEHLAERLRGQGVQLWLDLWALTPGDDWQREISRGLRASRACAVFVGPHGLGDWAREELGVAQDRAAKDRDFRLFMVLLPGAVKPDDPSLDFLANRHWVDLRPDIDDPAGFQDLLAAVSGVASRPAALTAAGDSVCPYRGLEVFEEEHAAFFFGRDDDTRRLVEKLEDSRFLAVLGPSGCGKSSLVRAGVVPALKQGTLPGSHTWTVCLITPGGRPLSRLAAQLAGLFGQEVTLDTLDRLRADERTLDLAVSLALGDRPDGEQMVLVVDQFEETFTLCADEAERAAFVANLCYAATIPAGRLVVVVAMRADFYHRCASYPQLAALAARQFLVSPLGADGLREVIERPAWRAGLELQPGLVDTVLSDVADRPGSLPLLEYVLLEVWQRRQGHLLTLEAYVASGGVEGALAHRADTTYEGLTAAQQQVARRVLLRLIQPGEGTDDTRCRAEIGELLTHPDEETDLEVVVKALADGRLLTTSQDEVSGARVVDVAHEALIQGWPQLRAWIEEDRELLRAHRRLTEAATEWDQGGREEGFLWRGARLAAWHDRPTEDLNDLERAFLDASREREARERAARRRRVRLALAGLSTALAIISTLAVLALLQRDLAFSRELVASAEIQLEADPELSIMLARRAFELRPTVEAQAALRQATLESRVRATLHGHDGPVWGVVFSPDGRRLASAGGDGTVRVWQVAGGGDPVVLRGHDRTVYSVAFSPDGRRLASSGGDGMVRVWQVAGGGDPVVLRGHDGGVRDVAFSPDGQRVASAGDDGTVRVWPLAGGDSVVLRGHDGGVYGVAFSPDGRRLASAGEGGTVRVWTLADSADQVVLSGHDGRVYGVAFSPDGQRLASAGGDGTVRVWPVAGGADPVVLPGHDGLVSGVAFSPDGQRVASAGSDGTVRVWPLAGGDSVVLRGHDRTVYSVAFSPDGQRLASGSEGTVRVWQVAGGDPVVLRGHDRTVWGVVFSPDGRRLASSGGDGTVRVWQVAGGGDPVVLRGHDGPVYGVAFSPDGQRVASAGGDGTVRVWQVAGGGDPVVLSGHGGRVYGVAFSPDGQRVASAGGDGTVRVWQAAGGGDPVVLSGHGGRVYGVAFSPDGQRVASSGLDETVRVWQAAGGGDPVVLRGHDGPVNGVAFSPDGQRLASASGDGTVRVWQAVGGADPIVLRGHDGPVYDVAFSPDGQRVVSAGQDGTVRVWDPTGGPALVRLRGHRGATAGVTFSPDGQRIASASVDGTVRVWTCEVCGPIEEVLALAEQRVTRELTDEERTTFLHEPPRS